MDRPNVAVAIAAVVGLLGTVVISRFLIESLPVLAIVGPLVLIAYRSSIRETDSGKALLAIVLLAVVVRIAAVIVLPAITQAKFGIPFSSPSDPVEFDAVARTLSNQPPETWQWRRSKGYEPFLASIYHTFGRTILVPRLINILFAALLVMYTYDLAENLFDDATAKIAAISVAFFPSLVVITVRMADDTIAIAFTVIGIYYLVKGRERAIAEELPIRSGLAFLGTLTVLWFARHQIALSLSAVFLAWFCVLVLWRVHHRANAYEKAAGGILLVCVLSVVGLYLGIPEMLDQFLDRWVSNNTAEAGAGFAKMIRASPTLVRMVLGTGALFLMPFPPWEVLLDGRFPPGTFMAVSSLILYLTVPFLIMGFTRVIRGRKRLLSRLPLLLITGFLVFAIATIYGGTVPRFRTQIEVFLLIFIAAGLTLSEDFSVYAIAYLPLILFIVAYYLLL